MPPFPNLPPKLAPSPITHSGVLSLRPPPPRPIIQNQVSTLPTLLSTSSNTGSSSQKI